MSYYQKQQPVTFTSSRTERRSWQRNQNTVLYAPKTVMGPITHTVLIALMVAVLGLIYLSQVTKTSSYGYVLEGQNTQMAALTAEQQDLQVENARLQALTRVRESSVAKAMTTPSSTQYTTQ